MFELIGLMFATAFLFVIGAVVSCVLATITWLLVRRTANGNRRVLVFAALLPIASVAYFWMCVALLPGESWFGDINELLPNGYILSALRKMPDFAIIENPKYPYLSTGISQCIGRIAIDGPFVVGRYSHPFGDVKPNLNEPYFLFDTRTSKTREFLTKAELDHELGHSISLTDVASFQSMESVAMRRRRLNGIVEFAPPILALCFLAAMVRRARARIRTHPSNIYT